MSNTGRQHLIDMTAGEAELGVLLEGMIMISLSLSRGMKSVTRVTLMTLYYGQILTV
jgi:hypothetical protein